MSVMAMRSGEIYVHGLLAGILTEGDDGACTFVYDEDYFLDSQTPPVCLAMPKTQREYRHEGLFPFFFNMLSEGENRKMQSRYFKLDEKDDFGILLATAQYDTAGCVTVKPIAV